MPFGTFDKKSLRLLKNQNRYKYVLGSYYGHIQSQYLEKNVLPRIGISNDDTMRVFIDKLDGKYDWKGSLQRLRLSLKNIKKERITQYEY